MKVLHVIPGIAPRYGGPSQAIVEMCRRLAASGTQVLIASTDADGGARLPVPLERPTEYQGVTTIFFRRQWSEAFKYSRPLSRWMRRHGSDFDVIHIHAVFSHASLAAAKAARSAGIPYVVRPLGTLSPWALRQKPLRKLAFWHSGVRRMLREADAIHYTSQPEQRQAETALGLSHGVVIPLGIDLAGAQPEAGRANENNHRTGREQTSDETGGYVLALGRLHPKKGLELLIEAFVDVVAGGLTGWTLKLAGDGAPEYVEHLKRRVREQSAEHLVEFTGWLKGQEKEAALCGAGLLAMPSYQENFGISMFEAMGRAVPVLASDQIDWAEEVAAAGAGWVSSLNRRSLADALAAALANRHERAARGMAGEALVRERFAWPVITARLQRLYAEIASSGARSLKHLR